MKSTRIFLLAVSMLLTAPASIEIYGQSRIRFAKGRTSATVTGSVAPSGSRIYVLGARYGQFLSANVSSKSDCIRFNNGATSTSYVTRNGDNRLSLSNRCSRTTSFSLTVSINFGSD